MSFWTRLSESRLFSWLQSRLAGGMPVETEAGATTRQRMEQAADEDERRVCAAVEAVIASHPKLNPRNFGIPEELYGKVAFYAAVDAVASLLTRYNRFHDRVDNDFVLHPCGTVCTIDSTMLIPGSTTLAEISCFTNRYRKDCQSSSIDSEHARAFLHWLMTAACAHRELLYGLRVSDIAGDCSCLTFELVSKATGSNPLDGWRVEA